MSNHDTDIIQLSLSSSFIDLMILESSAMIFFIDFSFVLCFSDCMIMKRIVKSIKSDNSCTV